MNERIIIHKSKKKSLFIILGGAALMGAAFLSFVYADDEVFGWIFIIAAAFIFILGFSGFRDREPQIILTKNGITELYSIKEEIDWDAIIAVNDFYFRGQDFVRLLIADDYKPDLIIPTWFWRFNRIFAQEGLKAMYIRVSGLEINSRQLVSIIERMTKTDPEHRDRYLDSVKRKF